MLRLPYRKDLTMIDMDKTIGELIAEDPQFLEFLIRNGFDQLKNPMIRRAMGGKMTLNRAIDLRKMDRAAFEAKLAEYEAARSPE